MLYAYILTESIVKKNEKTSFDKDNIIFNIIFMKVIEIFLQHQKRETIHQDNCSTCISKLCCVVFDILDERNQ